MEIKLSMQPMRMPHEEVKRELAVLNGKSAQYGLVLNEQQIQAITERRAEALKTTGRVEFGRGISRELIFMFCDSPYIEQDAYEETIVELQDLFYSLKGDTEEQISDDDLLDAMKYVFDEVVHGSLEIFENLPPEKLHEIVFQAGRDENEDWCDSDAYENKGDNKGDLDKRQAGELDRVYGEDRFDRPDNKYADSFYEAFNDEYRVGNDGSSRIGGSGL